MKMLQFVVVPQQIIIHRLSSQRLRRCLDDELGYDTYVGLQTEELQNIFNLPVDIHEYKGTLYYTTKELP